MKRNLIGILAMALVAGLCLGVAVWNDKPAQPAGGAAGLYNPGTYTASAQGCVSEVTVSVTVDANGITAAEIDASGETPALGGAAAETLLESILAGEEIEAVSGATMTSEAVKTALADCLSQAQG